MRRGRLPIMTVLFLGGGFVSVLYSTFRAFAAGGVWSGLSLIGPIFIMLGVAGGCLLLAASRRQLAELVEGIHQLTTKKSTRLPETANAQLAPLVEAINETMQSTEAAIA